MGGELGDKTPGSCLPALSQEHCPVHCGCPCGTFRGTDVVPSGPEKLPPACEPPCPHARPVAGSGHSPHRASAKADGFSFMPKDSAAAVPGPWTPVCPWGPGRRLPAQCDHHGASRMSRHPFLTAVSCSENEICDSTLSPGDKAPWKWKRETCPAVTGPAFPDLICPTWQLQVPAGHGGSPGCPPGPRL